MQTSMQKNVDKLWNEFKVNGITDPSTIVEQITYLLFYRILDVMESNHEKRLLAENKPKRALFFAKDQQHLRWNVFSQYTGGDLITRTNTELFPFLRSVGFNEYTYLQEDIIAILKLFQGAQCLIKNDFLLSRVMNFITPIDFTNVNENGELYQYILSKANASDKYGTLRTPKHIVRIIVEMLAPKQSEIVADPTCGTGSFLVESFLYENKTATPSCNPNNIQPDALAELLGNNNSQMPNSFYGFDIIQNNILFATMSMFLYGYTNQSFFLQDSLSDNFPFDNSKSSNEFCDVVFSTPPFGMKISVDNISKKLLKKLKSSHADALFLVRILDMLKKHGRAVIIVPERVLFSNSSSHTALRQMLINENSLDAVISLPIGIFAPHTRVKTSILFFTKGEQSENIFFFDVQSDGFSFDRHRKTLPSNDLPLLLKHWTQRQTLSINEQVKMLTDKTQKAFYVNAEEIRNNKYNFSLNSYQDVLPVERKSPQAIFAQIELLQSDIQASMQELKGVL